MADGVARCSNGVGGGVWMELLVEAGEWSGVVDERRRGAGGRGL